MRTLLFAPLLAISLVALSALSCKPRQDDGPKEADDNIVIEASSGDGKTTSVSLRELPLDADGIPLKFEAGFGYRKTGDVPAILPVATLTFTSVGRKNNFITARAPG